MRFLKRKLGVTTLTRMTRVPGVKGPVNDRVTRLTWQQDFTGQYLAALGCTGLHRAVIECTGLHWAVLGYSGLYWASLGGAGQ